MTRMKTDIMNKNDVPTMKDVAKEAGVSLGTVSKVINGIPSQSFFCDAGR